MLDVTGMMGARGLFGIHISFKHPFGAHSLLGGAAKTVAKIAPFVAIPPLSLAVAAAGKAVSAVSRSSIGRTFAAVQRVNSAMPGGAAVTTSNQPAQRAHRVTRSHARTTTKRRKKITRHRTTKRRR